MKCKRCFGRGFYLPTDGYTVADRRVCNKCGGSGIVSEYKHSNEHKKSPPITSRSNLWEVPKVDKKSSRASLYRRYGVEV